MGVWSVHYIFHVKFEVRGVSSSADTVSFICSFIMY